MDDLPFALWLGMILTVRVEPKAPGGGCPSPCDSLTVSTDLSPPHLEQKLKQEGLTHSSGRNGVKTDKKG